MENLFAVSRRDLFAAGGAAAILTAAPAHTRTAKPSAGDAARKFFPDGRVHPFAGNTVVCHLDQQGERSVPFDVLLDAYRSVPGRSYADKFTLLPPSSYHMTIFGGATDANREPGQWPIGIPSDAPITDCNRIVGERLKQAQIVNIPIIRMKVDPVDLGYDGNTLRMPLVPYDNGEAQKLTFLRNRLGEVIGVRSPNHDNYQFHVTIGYVIRPFNRMEQLEALADIARWKDILCSRSPVVELGKPEYCTFDDMFAFHRQFYLE